MTVTNRKKRLLGMIKDDKKVSLINLVLNKSSFYRDLTTGRYGIDFKYYILIVVGVGLFFVFLYRNTFTSPFVFVAIFLNGTVAPYVYIKQKYSKSKMKDAMFFKEFLDLLISEFVIGSSTVQAIEHIQNRDNLPLEVKDAFTQVLYDVRLGSGVVEALIDQRKRNDISKDFKVVLSVLIINHESGSADTIKGLESIGVQMGDRMDNIIDLKKAMTTISGERYLFFVMILFGPLYFGAGREGFYDFVNKSSLGSAIIAGAFLLSFVGQFIIDAFISKTVDKF